MTPEEKAEAVKVYEAKREARIERLEDRADSLEKSGTATVEQARKMASVIPFGQPILIGHHSEKRDRNYRGRIEGKFSKGFSELEKAKHYEQRAIAATANTAVFSDDPAATDKLTDKIARLEKQQELMRAANKLFRKKDVEGLRDLGFSDDVIARRMVPDFCGRIGFEDFALTNNSANIRRLKLRLKTVAVNQDAPTTEKQVGEVRIVDNPSVNRYQLFFPGKPSDEIRTALKAAGFRWSPTEGCWQGYRSAAWRGEQLLEKFYGQKVEALREATI